MRRVILAVTGTIAGLVALLAFRSHVPSVPTAAAEGTAGVSGAQPPATTSPLPPGARSIDGNVANTVYGPVQVQVVVRNSRITGVSILEQPSSTMHDLQIGQVAFPQLISETLSAQSAHIDAVSGASYTSAGYIQSLQSALDNGA
jgi:uncharacterized protein with FMN-binding domain